MKDFHVRGWVVANPVDKQRLADARFDLAFQAILHRMIKEVM